MDGAVTAMLTKKSITYLSSSNLHASFTVVTLTGFVITTESLVGSAVADLDFEKGSSKISEGS